MAQTDSAPRANEYLKTQVLTASPEQLQLMLYDGAIRFAEQAREAIEQQRTEDSYHLITRTENIVMEMCSGLRDEIAPDICGNMRRLYIYCYEQLVEANIQKDTQPLQNALRILRDMRETWVMLLEKLRAERNGEPTGDQQPSSDSQTTPSEPSQPRTPPMSQSTGMGGYPGASPSQPGRTGPTPPFEGGPGGLLCCEG